MARLPKLKKGLERLGWRRGILLGALLLLVLAGLKAQRVWGFAHSLRDRLEELQTVADGGAGAGMNEVGASLRGAHADLEALRSELAFLLPLTRYLGWVPGFGGDLRAASALVDVALTVTEAGTVAFDGLEPLVALTEGADSDDQPLALVLKTLSDARPDLEAAQDRLAAALERRSEIDDAALSERTSSLLAKLDRYLPLIQTGLDGARLLPDLLGASGRRAFLILAQNNDEMRATGGFISAVGKLILNDAEIVEIAFEDSYVVDDFSHPYPDSPGPVLRYMGIDQWVFRDANWSPDFPTAAQKAVEIYQISRDLEADGVLAVDQHALQTIVAALAPLEVEGWPEPVTGENVISLIQLAWSPNEVENWSGFDTEWFQQRKSFIGDLIGAMQTKVETTPGQVDWLALARAAFQVLDERHVQVWLADSAHGAVDLLAEQGWDGAVREATGDYLMVVDSNMGYNKANVAVQESLEYRVLVNADRTAQATLTVRHVHQISEGPACDHSPRYGADYDDLVNRCYWDYVRVYAPAGSQLSAATAHPVSGDLLVTGQQQAGEADVLPEESGKAVFGSFFVLPHGQQIETRFVYQLPRATLQRVDGGWRYRLLAQKQAGTHAIPLHVTLALPPGASVQSAELSEGAYSTSATHPSEPSSVVFDVTLERDWLFEVVFRFNEH